MAAAKKASRKGSGKTGEASKSRVPRDAIAMLKSDHEKVSGLFEAFGKARASSKKKALVAEICAELKVHTQLEDEIFYPAVKSALRDKQLVPEAKVEHSSIKALIAQVEGVEPDGEAYDATVKVMSEYVKHHVKEEQDEMFPKAKKTRLDLVDLRDKMLKRKEELTGGA